MVKKLITKTVAVVILLAMLVTLVVACGDSGTGSSTPKTETTTTPSGPDSTTEPSVSYDYPDQINGVKSSIEDGTVVEFIYVEGGSGTYTGDSIWVEDPETVIDTVSDKVIERNRKIQEDIGVDIYAYTEDAWGIGDLQANTKTYFDTQSDALDVYCGYQYYDISFASSGNLVNLNTLVNEDGDTIIDVSQPYWATNYIESITYNDLLYWVTGDLALRYIGGLYCTFVNLDIYDTLIAGSYDGRSIFKVVEDGDWTMRTMLDMAAIAWDDANHDGLSDEFERLGIVFETIDIFDGIAFGCDIDFGTKSTVGGVDTITVAIQNDPKAIELAGYFTEMFTNAYAYNAGNSDSENMMPIFANENTLFAVNKIYQATVYLSGMENYGIIPTPKLNDSQTDYASGVHDSLTIFGISKYSDCKEAAAATLELMAYYGAQLVAPEYYNNVLQGSDTVRNDESVKMIQKIRAGFDSDFVAAWSNSIENVVHVFRTEDNCKNFSVYIKMNSRKWPSKLTELLTQLEEASLEDISA